MSEPIARLLLTGSPQARVGAHTCALAAVDGVLLAWLVLEGCSSRERLAALLWPASDSGAARNALRQRLHRLRRQLGVELLVGTGTLQLAQWVEHDLSAGADGLLGDLDLPDSPVLDAWLRQQREGRKARSRQLLHTRIESLEAAGDIDAALPLARQLLQSDPLSEQAHRHLMRLHYLRGDPTAAMLAFDRCEQLLKHEVGARPSPPTLELLAMIEQATPLPSAPASRPPLPASVLRPPRLVGRDAELATLRLGLATGPVVVLVGDAGMGKSRLLQALADFEPGMLLASGRPGDPLVPYATLARALRLLLERDPGAADPALRRALAPLLPELGGGERRARQPPLAQPVLALLRQARHGVRTLALDDLHFADDATLDLLQALLAAPREFGATGLRWCLGMRPPSPHTRLQALLDALALAGPYVHVAVQPLGMPQMAELLDTLALPGFGGEALARQLHQRSGGNPLFALETLKLAWCEGGPMLADGLPRPHSLAQLIGEQLGRLSAPALQLARVAAVAGVDFSLAMAQSLLQRSALELTDAWSELEARQVLRGEGFAHDLIHDAVLHGLPEVIARHLHSQCAVWLQAQQGEPARIAAHWEAAGHHARALPALQAAAERAHRALREDERIAFLLRAADIAEAAQRPDEAFELVHSAIAGHMNTIRQADGLPLLQRLQDLARTPLQYARATGDRAWYAAVLGDLPQALSVGEDALRLALPLGDDALLATIRQRLGTALAMAARFDAALPHMRAAQGWMERRASLAERCEFQGNLAVVLDNLGLPAQAQAHHLLAIADAAAAGDHAQSATALANYALNRLEVGDLVQAVEFAGRAQQDIGNYEMAGSSAGFVAMLHAQCERALGHFSTALQWCDRAEAILSERNPARLPLARLHRAHIWLDLGQHARALQLLDGAGLQAARELPARYAVRWLVLLSRLKRRLDGRGAIEAAALLDEAQTLCPRQGWPELALIVACERASSIDLAEALEQLQQVADAARGRHLHATELGALLLGAHRALEHDAALARQWAHAALQLRATAHALHVDHGLRWLAPALALAQDPDAGARIRASACAQEGQEWLRQTASLHVPAAAVDSFMHLHPVNRLLLALRP